ncbi:MAG: hypothetical protein WBP44_04895 [Gammaproteobacteria bacterium]|jgi:hypothetical protein
MMRTTGFLVGVLLMLGIFLLALSASNSPTLVKEVLSSESALPAASSMDTEAAADVPVEDSIHTEVPAVADTGGLDETQRLEAVNSGLGLDPQSWNQSMGAYELALHKERKTESRYLVWSPFKSEWAAEGFARRLTLATDVPVEVRSEGPGNFQVVFSYRDDSERQAMVRQIETVTGLELE